MPGAHSLSKPGAQEGAYVQEACSDWPGLDVDLEAFTRYALARVFSASPPPLAHAGDLLLAFACVTNVSGAAAAFKRTFQEVMEGALSRRRASDAEAADVTQIVYERLLVGTVSSPPKLTQYRGHGPLRAWVATNVTTTLLMMRRSAKRRRERPEEEGAAVAGAGLETAYLKQRYRAEIEAAIVRALGRLPERARTLLRLHLGQRLTIDHLGAIYRVNRATTARWLSAARDALAANARAEIKAALRIDDSECDSLMTLMRGDLEVSVVRLLTG
jgi:RNA polymerase sigma-70 factor (ECF subfamily)